MDTTSDGNRHLLHSRYASRWGLLNARTLLDDNKLDSLDVTFTDAHLQLVALTESRRPTGSFQTEHFTWQFSGGHGGQAGVGLAFRHGYAQHIVDIRELGPRLVHCRVRLHNGSLLHVFVCYAPATSAHLTPAADDERYSDYLYEVLDRLSGIPQRDVVLLLGDFNAHIGRDYEEWPGVLGRHGLSAENGRGLLLKSFAAQARLCVANTMFRHKAAHQVTWCSAAHHLPRTSRRHQLDLVLVSQRHISALQDVRACWGVDVDSDHALVVLTVKLHLKRHRPPRPADPVPDLQKLREPPRAPGDAEQETYQSKFALAIQNKFAALADMPESAQAEFDNFVRDVKAVALAELGERPKRPKPSMDVAGDL